MKHSKLFIPCFILALLLGPIGCGGGEGEAAIDPQVVAQGQEIFTTTTGICFTCHGADATGTQLAPNLTDDTWLNLEQPVTIESIEALIRTGVPDPVEHPAPMPPMAGVQLTDEQITAVATYVYSLSHGA